MGIMFKQFQFDGELSGNYGLYISGAGVYNAPVRDVEMLTIPGRNGAFPLDHGRFENIEVTYPAGIFGSSESDFAAKVQAARNWLCSKKGYVRLMDFYNPAEYRLAVYKSGLSVTPTMNKAGEFDLTFECKPQRFLLQGDRKTTITTAGTWALNNTRFEARPLLEVEGYGDVTIDGRTVTIDSEPLGNVLLANGQKQALRENNPMFQYKLDTSQLNNGDTIGFQGYNNGISVYVPGTITKVSNFTNITGTAFNSASGSFNYATIYFDLSWNGTYGTASSNAASCRIQYTENGTSKTATFTVNFYVSASGYATVTCAFTQPCNGFRANTPAIYGNSTITALGQPLYIDCDTGQCYKIENNEVISVNSGVIIGADLPVLLPGNRNVIEYDSTITSLKIKPRTWII